MDPIKKAIRYVEQGSSARAAALKSNVPITTLHNHLKKNKLLSSHQKQCRYNDNKKENAIALRKSGMSFSEISLKTGVNAASVKRWCTEIKITDKQIKKNLGALVEKQKLAVEYRRSGMFVTEISKKLNCSKSSVSLWLKNHQEMTGENLNELVVSRKASILLRKNTTSINLNSKGRLIKKDVDSASTDNKFISTVTKKYKSGISSYEIGLCLGVSKDKVLRAVRLANFTVSEKEEIKIKAKERMKLRRAKGELKPAGGVREKSGRAKTGYYKSIYCGSTYELCWVIYNLDHHVEFSRFPGALKSGETTYVPDFLLSDGKTIVELKGYEKEDSVEKKTAVAKKHGYNVVVLRKEDLASIFDYVKQNYGVDQKGSYVLYDGHKPSYEYTCSHCKCVFASEVKKKSKSGIVFCSRTCTGKSNSIIARQSPLRIKPKQSNPK